MEPPQGTPSNKKVEWAFSDFLKKAFLTGTSALFMTEEGLRSFLNEFPLPKEVVQFVVNQVSKTKEDLSRLLAKEVREFLESINFVEQLRQLLASTELEIHAQVRFVPQDKSIQPKSATKISISTTTNAGSNQQKKKRRPKSQ